MYCSVSCRDSDWTKSHEQSCLHTRSCYEKDTHRAAVLNLSNTQLASVGGIYSFDNVAVCVMQRLIQSIGIEEIQRAAINNEPMLSWSAKDPRTRGFRHGKFATVDLEALISLEDNFDKLNDIEKACYAKVN
jgi:hypothetical protein